MKMSKRSLIITVIVACFAVFLATILLLANSKKLAPHINVAFYEVPDAQKKALTTQLETLTDEKGKTLLYTYTEFDSTIPLASQMKRKHDIVFAPMGKNANDVTAKFSDKKAKSISLPASVLDGSTISVHQKAGKEADGSISELPLLLDHYEIDIDRELLNQCGIKTIATWHDLEAFAFAAQKYVASPVVFAGGDSDTMLGIFGALVECFSGKKAYDNAVDTLTKAIYGRDKKAAPLTALDYETIIKSLSETDDAPFYDAAQLLARWSRLGLLHSETFHMTKPDVAAFMSAKSAGIVFMTLTQHREVEHNTIERYSSIYYPSEQNATLRYFSAPVLCGIPVSTNKNAHLVLTKLASSEQQEPLSRAAGLAPIQANCRVADHQADDVRYWIAATNAPLVPFGDAVFTNEADKKTFAAELAAYIRYLPN